MGRSTSKCQYPTGGAYQASTGRCMPRSYLRRGRIVDPGAPWVDEATTRIPLQYVLTHYAAAEAHALLGDEGAAARHVARARWWNAVTENRLIEADRAGNSLPPAPAQPAG
jgi:hypothetical protein